MTVSQFHSLETLNFSSVVFYRHMTEVKDKTQLNSYGSDYVDVRDLSMATVLALQVESAGGQRLILDAGEFSMLVNPSRSAHASICCLVTGSYTFQNLCKIYELAIAVTYLTTLHRRRAERRTGVERRTDWRPRCAKVQLARTILRSIQGEGTLEYLLQNLEGDC